MIVESYGVYVMSVGGMWKIVRVGSYPFEWVMVCRCPCIGLKFFITLILMRSKDSMFS